MLPGLMQRHPLCLTSTRRLATHALGPPVNSIEKTYYLKAPSYSHCRLIPDKSSPSAPADGHITRIADVECLSTSSSLAHQVERSSSAPATPTTSHCRFSAFRDNFVHWHESLNQNQAVLCPNSLRMPLS